MTKIEAKIIAGSVSPQGHRIATWIATFPRHILAELNTHRMLSRNSASSRAIPFQKMLTKVMTDPFVPIKWMKEHKGMQGTDYFTEEEANARGLHGVYWLSARDNAVEAASRLSSLGVSKQTCNRLLEPFMWHTAIITATEIENFTALRDDPGTEIHFQELAHQMLTTWNEYKFKPLQAGEWHMPFGDQISRSQLTLQGITGNVQEIQLKIATARCARISYGTFEGKDDYEADIKLHDRLAASGHWSPFEHCARAMSHNECIDKHYYDGTKEIDKYSYGWCGNFRGWIQYRKLFPNENKKDVRVKQHEQ